MDVGSTTEARWTRSIVITGSTRGIGYGLAESFLALGCAVTVSGRTEQGVQEAVTKLRDRHDGHRILGVVADVTDRAQIQSLWDQAKARFARVDIWVNNAGQAHAQSPLSELPPDVARDVIETNVLGVVFGSGVALRGMLDQGFGAIYNMEGLGSDGRKVQGLALYGASKRGVQYLTECLVEEARGTPVIVGSLRPGMVMTEMITRQYEGQEAEWERARRIFSILADRVDTVAPWLAEKMLANEKSGARISWMNGPKLLMRFLLAPFRRRENQD